MSTTARFTGTPWTAARPRADARGVRCAAGLTVLTLVALVVAPSGLTLLGAGLVGGVATGLALAAALLNAAFGLWLGCEVSLLARRTLH